jgi:Flp pilus assembly protein TadD
MGRGCRRGAVFLAAMLAVAAPAYAGDLEQAADLYRKGDYAGAAAAYERAVAGRRDAGTLALAGNAHFRAGAIERAVARYQDALALEPDTRGVLRNLGRALYVLGRCGESARALARAIGGGGAGDVADLRLLASALALADDAPGAVLVLERAAVLAPEDPAIRLELGVAEARAGAPAAAALTLRDVLRRAPDLVAAYVPLKYALAAAGDTDGAIVALDTARLLDVADAAALAFLGDLVAETERRPR